MKNANGAGLEGRLALVQTADQICGGQRPARSQWRPRAIGRPWTRCARSAISTRPLTSAWALLDPEAARPGEEQIRPYQEVACATIIRAVHSRAQLYERMVGFWHDHFNVLATDDRKIGCALPAYDRDAIRVACARQFPRHARSRRGEPRHAGLSVERELARRAVTTRISPANFWSCTRSGATPISTATTTAGAMFRAPRRASRPAISMRMSTRPRAPSPAGPSRTASASTRNRAAPHRQVHLYRRLARRLSKARAGNGVSALRAAHGRRPQGTRPRRFPSGHGALPLPETLPHLRER